MYDSYFFAEYSFIVVVLDRIFFHLGDKKVVAHRVRQLVVLCSNDCTEFAWVDPALVVLDDWSSYRGGCLNMFDCSNKLVYTSCLTSFRMT